MNHNPILTDHDRAFYEEARKFFTDTLAPRATDIEDKQDWAAIREVVKACGDAGYLRLIFPDLYQGSLHDPGLTHAVMVAEMASYHNYAFETTIASSLSCAMPLYKFGSDSLKKKYLDGLLDGDIIGAICMTEDDAGSDVSAMKTKIEIKKDKIVINGRKRYISNASVADLYQVYGISDSSTTAHKGMSVICVPADTKGISFPKTYTFMGRRGCVVGEIEFDNCEVPLDHLIGDPNEGFKIMLKTFNFERILLGGSGVGLARSAFDIACNHAQKREAFGSKLGAKQLIWDKIARMSCELDAAMMLTSRAARLYDQGIDGKELMKPASMAKLKGSQAANFCADEAVQILGGDGITKEFSRAEQIYRDARSLPIVGGSTEMVKYLIASVDLPDIKLNL